MRAVRDPVLFSSAPRDLRASPPRSFLFDPRDHPMPGSLRMSTMFESAALSEPNELSRPASHAATSGCGRAGSLVVRSRWTAVDAGRHRMNRRGRSPAASDDDRRIEAPTGHPHRRHGCCSSCGIMVRRGGRWYGRRAGVSASFPFQNKRVKTSFPEKGLFVLRR
jgi:hypothetical protein